MPYERKGNCVYNKETGKKKGCSSSAAKAKEYMKALYASELQERVQNTVKKVINEKLKGGQNKLDANKDGKISGDDFKLLRSKSMKEGGEYRTENYMFFSNLKQMRRQIEFLMEIDPQVIEMILQNGHDWADDHVTEAKTNMDQVFDFIMNEIK
jgi:hypothetical protein